MALQGRCLTSGERAVVAALTDVMAAPEPPLPPVADTDAVDAVDAWVTAAPALNRAALRAGLRLVGAGGFAARDRAARARVLKRIERSPLAPLVRALTGLIVISYYGDDEVSRLLGYDAEANLARARGALVG